MKLYKFINDFCKFDISTTISNKEINVKEIIHLLIFAICFQLFFSSILLCFKNTHVVSKFVEYQQNLNAPLVLVALIAPIYEEIIFRKLTLDTLCLNTKLKFIYCNIIQALIFAVFHVNILRIGCAFIYGILLGIIYVKYKNLIMAILFHIFTNSSPIILRKIIYSQFLIPVIILSLLVIVYECFRLIYNQNHRIIFT